MRVVLCLLFYVLFCPLVWFVYFHRLFYFIFLGLYYFISRFIFFVCFTYFSLFILSLVDDVSTQSGFALFRGLRCPLLSQGSPFFGDFDVPSSLLGTVLPAPSLSLVDDVSTQSGFALFRGLCCPLLSQGSPSFSSRSVGLGMVFTSPVCCYVLCFGSAVMCRRFVTRGYRFHQSGFALSQHGRSMVFTRPGLLSRSLLRQCCLFRVGLFFFLTKYFSVSHMISLLLIYWRMSSS